MSEPKAGGGVSGVTDRILVSAQRGVKVKGQDPMEGQTKGEETDVGGVVTWSKI